MYILKSFGVVIVTFILRNLLKLHRRKIIPIECHDEPTTNIPIKWR